MLLSVENMIIRRRIGDKAAVDLLKEAGFTGIDYSLCGMEDWDAVAGSKNALSYAEDLRRYAEDRGVVFSQSHAPFTFKYGMEMSVENPHIRHIIQAMEFASHLGCPMIVVHGILVPEGEDVFAYNLDYYQRLLPYAEKYGILIAVENLTGRSGRYTQPTTRLFGSPEAFCHIQDLLDSPWICGCLDLGHANMTFHDVPGFIRGSKGHFRYVHIHDNDGLQDLHELPVLNESDDLIIHWDETLAALREVGYDGAMNLELVRYMKRFPTEHLPCAMRLAALTGQMMIEEFTDPRPGRFGKKVR